MANITINWGRNLDPNKKIVFSEDPSIILIPQRCTYGTYPITDTVRNTAAKIRK